MQAVIACDTCIGFDVVDGNSSSAAKQYAMNVEARSMVVVNRMRILVIS